MRYVVVFIFIGLGWPNKRWSFKRLF